MSKTINKDLEIKFFAAEMRSDLPSLDLHSSFEFGQIEILLDQFLYKQSKLGEMAVSVIYGGGKGILRDKVLKILENHPLVVGVKDQGGHCLVVLEKIVI